MSNHEAIVLYFYGDMAEIYQLEQWLKVLEALHVKEKLRIIVQHREVYASMIEKTEIPVSYVSTVEQLLTYYSYNSTKVILYVNNGMKNFNSLSYTEGLHIHLNHGESEKSSMHSNQCKAYDYVFIVGDAAYDRYKRHVLNTDSVQYIKIGRPQFDHISKVKKEGIKKVILYAPTDESTHISMRYTSLERIGIQIIDTLLENDSYDIIYRPHPSTGKHSKIVDKINKQVIQKIEKSSNGRLETDIDAIDLLSSVDMAIFDNSSLIIDFLQFDCPMFATDMFLKEYHDRRSFKMLDGCLMLDESNIHEFGSLIEHEFEYDTCKEKRKAIQAFYLGEYGEGESTEVFIQKVLYAIDERDSLMKEKLC